MADAQIGLKISEKCASPPIVALSFKSRTLLLAPLLPPMLGLLSMAEDRIPMTQDGKKALEDELKRLMTVERPQVIAAIETARAHGDISENADYDAAKERQGFIEGRIQEINGKLARAEVIDPSSIQTDKVVFGATVDLDDVDSGKRVTYKIVGVDEANAASGKIGITSPLARALIGKREGDEVTVNAPKGSIQYEIIKISYR